MADEAKNFKVLEEVFKDMNRHFMLLAVSSGETAKQLKKLITQDKRRAQIIVDNVRVGEERIRELRGVEYATREVNKASRALISTMKEQKSTSEKVDAAAKAMGTTANVSAEEFKRAFSEFSRGKINLRDFVKNLGGTTSALGGLWKVIGGGVSSIALMAGAFKLLLGTVNQLQGGRRFEAGILGEAGAPPTKGLFSSGYDSLKMLTTLQSFGMDLKEAVNAAKSIGGGFTTGLTPTSTKGEVASVMSSSREAVIASVAIQKRYNISLEEANKIFMMMRFNLGLSSEKLAGSFKKLSESLVVEGKGTLSAKESMQMFSQLSPMLAKYNADIGEAGRFIKHFSTSLKAGVISIDTFSGILSEQRGASTDSLMRLMMLSRRFGLSSNILPDAGLPPLEQVGQFRAKAEKSPFEFLRLSMRTSEAAAGGMVTSPVGLREMMRKNPLGLPGLSTIGNMQMEAKVGGEKVKIFDEMINLVKAGDEKGFNKLIKDLEKVTKEESDKVVKQAQNIGIMTMDIGSMSEILKRVSAGGASFAVTSEYARKNVKPIADFAADSEQWKNLGSYLLDNPSVLGKAALNFVNPASGLIESGAGFAGEQINKFMEHTTGIIEKLISSNGEVTNQLKMFMMR